MAKKKAKNQKPMPVRDEIMGVKNQIPIESIVSDDLISRILTEDVIRRIVRVRLAPSGG